MVVTNGYFTEQAVILARANGVWMRSRDDLARKLTTLDRAKQLVPEGVNSVDQLAS
jgi:hypothetical protein